MPLLPWLGRTKVSVQTRVTFILFQQGQFLREELSAPHSTPKLEYHPLSALRDCLVNMFAVTLRIGGRFSIRNLRTQHALVTGTLLSLQRGKLHNKIFTIYAIQLIVLIASKYCQV
jgi:hypothetical protein